MARFKGQTVIRETATASQARISFGLLCTCLIFLLTHLGAIGADLPPSSYDKLKAEASEYLKIEVLKVSTENADRCLTNIVYLARVLEAYRSGANLKINDKIEIGSWTMKKVPSCEGGGPRAPTLLSPGWFGNAYLNAIENPNFDFSIAAYGESFEGIESGGIEREQSNL